MSQSILSTKHLTTSATIGNIVLDDITKKVFSVKKNGYVLNIDYLKDADSVLFIVNQEECPGLKDLTSIEKVKMLDPERVSKISTATVEIWKDGEVERLPVTLKDGNRPAVFERRFLEYIVNNGVSIDENNNYIINISKWKLASTMMWLPEIEYSFFTLMTETKNLIYTRKVMKGGVSKDSPEALLTKLFSLVNSKLSVNIAPLEVIVYAFMVKDLKNENYDLARLSDDPQLVNIGMAVDYRSMGAGYGFKALVGKVFKAKTFFKENKTTHPLDVLFKPKEVLEHDLSREKYDYGAYAEMDFDTTVEKFITSLDY
jgi:hypothetical protein